MDELGIETGDKCNRNGCTGIISEHKKESGCSCHINPPCSTCVDDRHYCEDCQWQAIDDQKKSNSNIVPSQVIEFKVRRISDLDKTKIDWLHRTHTHFSMIIYGVYPESTTMEDVEKKVRGTFGGRFTKFNNGEFEYIAYTD